MAARIASISPELERALASVAVSVVIPATVVQRPDLGARPDLAGRQPSGDGFDTIR
jgi:hypothetical protein